MTGSRRRRAPPSELAYKPGQLLDWRDSSHYSSEARPCRYCDRPTHLRDSKRRPAHKTCTEEALARQHADAADAYHQNGQT